MKKKVTSTDIAHAAGVSQSTVSMILNKKYDVSFAKDTVERVENAAKELGYVPPKRKTRKGTKREKLLVVFCPNLTNPYYVMLLQGIEAHAKEKGFGLFVCNTQRDLRMEERYLKMMWQLRPLGIIYTCNPSHCFMELVGEIAEHGETSAGTGTQESCIYSTAAYGKAEAAFEAGRGLPERI